MTAQAQRETDAAVPRILVTGASGFVGGELLRSLRAAGVAAWGVGRRQLDADGYLSWDVSQPWPAAWEREPLRPTVVVHAAARSSPWGTRREYWRDNVLATQHALEFCQRVGHAKLVYVSSASVFYRAADQWGITEESEFPQQFVNEYSRTKREAEKYVEDYRGAWTILRPRAVLGPRDTVLLPRILRAARAGRLPLLYRPGGAVVGDVIYSENLTDYLTQAALRDDVRGSINVTNNEPVEIMPLLLDVLQRLHIPAPRRRVSVRRAWWAAGVVEFLYRLAGSRQEPPLTRFGVHVFAYSKTFDVGRMLAVLGPPRIPLREGIARIVAALQTEPAS